jgi:hypothetical protein
MTGVIICHMQLTASPQKKLSKRVPKAWLTERRSGSGLRAHPLSMAARSATGISGTDSTKGQLLDRQLQWRPASSRVGSRCAMICNKLQRKAPTQHTPASAEAGSAARTATVNHSDERGGGDKQAILLTLHLASD